MPPLTALQFLIIDELLGHELSGRELRERLRKRDVRKSLPAFYQLMARLEDAKFVKCEYRNREIDGQIVRESWYRLTGSGQGAYRETQAFFATRQGGPSYA